MARLISAPTVVRAAGTKPKLIEELVGRANTSTAELSIARMRSPASWEEPGQTPEYRGPNARPPDAQSVEDPTALLTSAESAEV